MEVKASLNNLRISPRKVRLVANLIKGMGVKEAVFQLKYLNKKSASYLIKLIESASANASNNLNLEKDNLYIKSIMVNQGTTLKRWMPRAFGRASGIKKKNSKINVILAERIVKSEAKKTESKAEKKVVKQGKVAKKIKK